MRYIIGLLFIFTCSCDTSEAGTYRTEKTYIGPTNGRYRIDTVFHVLKKGKYIYQEPAPKKDDSNPAMEQYERDLIFGD